MQDNLSLNEQLVIKELIGIPLTTSEQSTLIGQIPTDVKKAIVTRFTNPTNFEEIKAKVDLTVRNAIQEIFSHCEDVDLELLDACTISEVYDKKGNEYIKAIRGKQ